MSIKVPSVVVHPFDLNRSQVELTLEQFFTKKSSGKNANKLASASINYDQDVIASIEKMVDMPLSLVKNLKQQFNTTNFDQKITFSELLLLLQREAFFRDALSEAQIFRLSSMRFSYQNQCKFVTKHQLEQIKEHRNDESDGEQPHYQVPNFSYLIEIIVMFRYNGVLHVIAAYENKSVQVFDFQTGLSIFEFDFLSAAAPKANKTLASAASRSAKLKLATNKVTDQSIVNTEESRNYKFPQNFTCDSNKQRQGSSVSAKVRNKATMLELFRNKQEFSNQVKDNLIKKILVPEILRAGIHQTVQTEIRKQNPKKPSQSIQSKYNFPVLGIDSILDQKEIAKQKANKTDNRLQKELKFVMKGSGGVLEQNKAIIQNRIRLRETSAFDIPESQYSFLNFERVEENFGKLTQLFSDLKIAETPNKIWDGSNMSKEQEATNIKRAKTMEQIRQNWQKVEIKTNNFKENLGRGASLINQMIILNTAGTKLEEQIVAEAGMLTNKQQFNLLQSMEDDASNVHNQMSCNKHFYKTIFPEKEIAIKDVIHSEACSLTKEEESKQKKPAKSKLRSYPMAMTFQVVQGQHLIVFALVTSLVIYEVKQSAAKQVFQQVCEHQIDEKNEFLPIKLDACEHKVKSGVLQVAVACESSKINSHGEHDFAVILLEVDLQKNFKVTEIFQQESRRKMVSKMITKILLRDCGLIMACYQGYIELFDRIKYQSKLNWDNQIEVPVNVNKGERKFVDTDFSKQLVQLRNASEPEQSIAQKIQRGVKKESKQSWKKETEKKEKYLVTIDSLDYSSRLDLIAFGGVSGEIGILDSTTFCFKGMYKAHSTEVAAIYFQDSECQMITIAKTGEVHLWDAQRMEIKQTVRNKIYQKCNSVSTACFFADTGTLLLATSKVFKWELKDDTSTRIQNEQQTTVAQDFLKLFRSSLEHNGYINQEEQKPEEKSLADVLGSKKSRMLKAGLLRRGMTATNEVLAMKPKDEMIQLQKPHKYFESLFKQENLAQFQKSEHVARKGRTLTGVLPSTRTELVACFYISTSGKVFTLDVDSLVRCWSLETGQSEKSYPLETHSDGSPTKIDLHQNFVHKEKIKTAALASDNLHLAVAFEGAAQCLVQVYNLHTGCILYNTGSEDKLYTDGEVATLTFFKRENKYWFVATCWEGKVSFFSAPMDVKGKKFLTVNRVRSESHRRDVVCSDTTLKNHIATGSIDNVICFWQSFSATENKVIRIPRDMANPLNRYLRNLKFVDPTSNEHLLVFMSDGLVFCLETLTEMFITNEKDSYELTQLARFNIIDIQDSKLLSVGEKGKNGYLHKIIIDKGSNFSKVKLTLLGAFKIENIKVSACCQLFQQQETSSNTITQVKMLSQRDFFMVSQANGTITIKSLTTFETIGSLNDAVWDPKWSTKLNNKFEIQSPSSLNSGSNSTRANTSYMLSPKNF